MKLKYNVEIEDMIVFGEDVSQQEPHVSLNRRTRRLAVVLSMLLAVFFAPWVKSGVLLLIPLFAVWAYFAYPWFERRQRVRWVRKAYGHGAHPGLLGAHELEIAPDGLIERTDVNEQRQFWRGFMAIRSVDDYTFAMIGPMNGYVIPRHGVVEGDYDEFVKELARMWRFATEHPDQT